MKNPVKIDGLKCPYCEGMFPSHITLRIHVGKAHKDRIDEFMAEFFGGRKIEVDFIAFLLQRAISDLTSEFCDSCGKCNEVCPVSRVKEDFKPLKFVNAIRSNQIKDILKNELVWYCSSCLACKDQCPEEISPFDIIRTLKILSARINYHFPKTYIEANKRITSWGIIQKDLAILTKSGAKLKRSDLSLPAFESLAENRSFIEALRNLKSEGLIL